MRAYHVYILGHGGKVTESIDLLDCFDDKTAKTRARQLANDYGTVTVRLRLLTPHLSDDHRGGGEQKPRRRGVTGLVPFAVRPGVAGQAYADRAAASIARSP
jgi:hypothetical protein